MSSFQVMGLLDRPSRQSLGMLGIVVERLPRQLYVEGIVGMSGEPIDRTEFDQLLQSGDAQRVNGQLDEDENRACAALWVGREFATNADQLSVPLPPFPKTAVSIGDDGTCWIGPIQHIWRVLDSWLVRAFRRSIREGNAELATLMSWVLPDREETRAAIWHTKKSERKANLDWWARLDRDHGDPKVTSRKLDERFGRLASDVLSQTPQQVFGFCALAKGGDNEIAKELSNRLNVPRISFGHWLREKALKEEVSQPIRRVLQQKGQQMIETHGALEFCLEVLGDLPPNVSIPNVRFVIDGIRHTEVLKSLQTLIGEENFFLVHIERPEAERRRLLIQEEHIPANEVDAVMSDSTEQEISGVATFAAKTYHREGGAQGGEQAKRIAMELAGI